MRTTGERVKRSILQREDGRDGWMEEMKGDGLREGEGGVALEASS